MRVLFFFQSALAAAAGSLLSVCVTTEAARLKDGYRVAFFGNSLITSSRSIWFSQLASWNLDLIVHSGGLSHVPNQVKSINAMKNILGTKTKFVSALGNPDVSPYDQKHVETYGRLLRAWQVQSMIWCTGIPGVMERCSDNGIVVLNLAYRSKIQARMGIKDSKFVEFIHKAFRDVPNEPKANWRICNFHSPVRGFSVETAFKAEEGDPWVADICGAYGAVITNGASKMYTRTPIVNSYQNMQFTDVRGIPRSQPDSSVQVKQLPVDEYTLAPGRSIQWVSGVTRPTKLSGVEYGSGKERFSILAKALTQHGGRGAVVCTFYPKDRTGRVMTNSAVCEFVTVTGVPLDRFVLRSEPLLKSDVKNAVAVVDAERKALARKRPDAGGAGVVGGPTGSSSALAADGLAVRPNAPLVAATA